MSPVTRWLAVVLATLVVTDIGLFIAGIWTGDERWSQTGVVVLIVAGVVAAAAGASGGVAK